jgi:hypothetical protein
MRNKILFVVSKKHFDWSIAKPPLGRNVGKTENRAELESRTLDIAVGLVMERDEVLFGE